MPTVTREIHIDAPPDEVRRHVADPARRRGWLDDEGGDAPPSDGRILEYPSPRGPGQVRIEVVPDRGGSRVTVTEEVDLPVDAAPPEATLAGRGVRLAPTVLQDRGSAAASLLADAA